MVIGLSHARRRFVLPLLVALCTLLPPGCASTNDGGGHNGIVDAPLAYAPLLPSWREPGRDVYRLAFAGGEPALIAIAAPDLEPLRLSVVDATGRSVCYPVRQRQTVLCEWQPAHAQEVVIEVTNMGGIDLSYRLWTN